MLLLQCCTCVTGYPDDVWYVYCCREQTQPRRWEKATRMTKEQLVESMASPFHMLLLMLR